LRKNCSIRPEREIGFVGADAAITGTHGHDFQGAWLFLNS
jgi:hypothetical protein